MFRFCFFMVGLLALPGIALAAYPGVCTTTIYSVGTTTFPGNNGSWSISATGSFVKGTYQAGVTGTYYKVAHYWKPSESQGFQATFISDGYFLNPGPGTPVSVAQFTQTPSKLEAQGILSCGNPCTPKTNQPGSPIYTGLPYDSQYYETAGICDDGCVAKPASGVTSNTYAQDGSGYIIGPWTYTGEQCQSGITPDLPPQPPPEDQDDAGNKACQSKCAGRAYQYDPETGQCECFGAPGTIDPPLDPTVPVPDPGSPSVPGAQTPATDPGGDAQLGAQIANQAKQIGQGDAQLGQLGAINNKLSAVIGNQGKQIGQGDKILDYQRRQLAALEDIRNDLAEDENGEVPDLPDQPELDGSIPDAKNWTEYDDADAIGQAQGQKQIDIIEGAQSDSPFNFGINTAGSEPCLSGPMFGTQIDICFNRPWMLTGYAIMNGITISVGYLQAFLMIQKVVTGA